MTYPPLYTHYLTYSGLDQQRNVDQNEKNTEA